MGAAVVLLPVSELDLARAAAPKLLPNLVRVGIETAATDGAVAVGLLAELTAESADAATRLADAAPASPEFPPPPPPLLLIVVEVEFGSLLRPANSCLFDLRVVDGPAGRRVLELADEFGAGVVLVVVVVVDVLLDEDLVALNRVWNLLFLLPNMRLVEAADSVVEPAIVAAPVLLVGCSLLAGGVTVSATEDEDEDGDADGDVDGDADADVVLELVDTETLMVGWGLAGELVACCCCCCCCVGAVKDRLVVLLDGWVGCGLDAIVLCVVVEVVAAEVEVEVEEEAVVVVVEVGGIGDETAGTELVGRDWVGGARVNPLPVFPSGVAGLPLLGDCCCCCSLLMGCSSTGGCPLVSVWNAGCLDLLLLEDWPTGASDENRVGNSDEDSGKNCCG